MISFPNLQKNAQLQAALREEFSPSRRGFLGPIDTSKIGNAEAAAELLDIHNQAFIDLLTGRSLIVGRKGAEKSALLHAYNQRPYYYNRLREMIGARRLGSNYDVVHNYDIIIQINSAQQLTEMQRSIADEFTAKGIAPTAEGLSQKWREELWKLVLRHLIENVDSFNTKDSQILLIKDYFFPASMEFKAIDALVNAAQAGTSKSNPGTSQISFEAAITAGKNYMKRNKLIGIILFDSMEEYEVQNQALSYTLKGLLRCIWEYFNHEAFSDHLQIRCCIPSEIYNYLGDKISANRGKDFQNVDFLHWSPMDLFRIAAHRYAMFAFLYDREFFDSNLSMQDLGTRAGVRAFWTSIFPAKIVGRRHVEEDTFAYIARHSQLLPRQIIQILGEAMSLSHGSTGGIRKISADAIKAAVAGKEGDLLGDIFTAFRYLYPNASEVCRFVMPRLPIEFYYGFLHRVWNEAGKHHMVAMGKFSFPAFWDMLMEMGLMGLVDHDETKGSDRYVVGRFEYNERGRIVLGATDQLCLHPILIPKYVKIFPKGDIAKRTIYPRGSGLDDGIED